MKGSREFCKDSVVAVLSETPTQPRDDDCKDLGQFAQVVSCLGLDTRAKRQRLLPMVTRKTTGKNRMTCTPGLVDFCAGRIEEKRASEIAPGCWNLRLRWHGQTWSDMVRHGQTWSAGVDLVRSWIASSAFGSLVLEGRRAVGWSRMFWVQLWLPEILLTRKSMEWSDTPEKIENEKTDETPYVDTQARGVWICLQVLKIALEAVKSRINRRDQLWKSSNAWLVGGSEPDWRFWTLTHYLMPIPCDSNHIQPFNGKFCHRRVLDTQLVEYGNRFCSKSTC